MKLNKTRKIIIFYNKFNKSSEKKAAHLGNLLAQKKYKVVVSSKINKNHFKQQTEANKIRLIVLGGDGTINHVVNLLFEIKKNFADLIMPELALTNMGTGSDYVKSIYGKKNTRHWKNYLLENNLTARPVDIGLISGLANNQPFHRYFVNILGIGLSAAVVHDKNKNEKDILMKYVPNFMAYIIPTLKNIISYLPINTKVIINDKEYDFLLKACFIAKGSYSGGGMKFGSQANLFDGEFDVTAVGDISLFELYQNLLNTYSEKSFSRNKILSIKSPHLSFKFFNPVSIEYDGELLTQVTELNVQIIKSALPVCFKHTSP